MQEHLTWEVAYGDSGCVECVIGPTPPPGGSRADFRSCFLRTLKLTNKLAADDPTGIRVVVPLGSGPLVCAVTNEAGTVPEGVALTITAPDGTVVNGAVDVNSVNATAVVFNGALTTLVVAAPEPGVWTLQATADNSAGEFFIIFYATPLVGAYDALLQTAGNIIDEETFAAHTESFGQAKMKCKTCKDIMWGCAAALVAIMIAGGGIALAALLTPASPIVAAIGVILGITAATLLSWMFAKEHQYGLSTGDWATALCMYKGHC